MMIELKQSGNFFLALCVLFFGGVANNYCTHHHNHRTPSRGCEANERHADAKYFELMCHEWRQLQRLLRQTNAELEQINIKLQDTKNNFARESLFLERRRKLLKVTELRIDLQRLEDGFRRGAKVPLFLSQSKLPSKIEDSLVPPSLCIRPEHLPSQTIPQQAVMFECPICLQRQTPSAMVLLKECKHAFCRACINNWVITRLHAHEKPECPLCRHEIKLKSRR